MKTLKGILLRVWMIFMSFGFYGLFYAICDKIMTYSSVDNKYILVAIHIGILLIGLKLFYRLYNYLQPEE